jgi:dTDP-4-dehydrorhamnose 3,5-epimerase
VIEPELLGDERGWFARTFDADEFRSRGMSPEVVQCNASFNARRGTLRGMHYQADPHGESKLVRCVRGSIFDVAVDLRGDSPTYRGWHTDSRR